MKLFILTLIIILNMRNLFPNKCFTGAFIADQPSISDIENFERDFGKKPYFVLIFTDWNYLLNETVLNAIKSQNCVPFISWEPWYAASKKGINYDLLLEGVFDDHIKQFISQIKKYKETIYLRFAHEMNGNWYPWSGSKIGSQKYIDIYKYIYNFFKKENVTNVKWVFSINWENIPKDNNSCHLYYPGNEFVDFIGLDGYNWGNTQTWSKWITFKELFAIPYHEITLKYNKPIIISEFASTSQGGNKTKWIITALRNIQDMPNIKGFILFNKNKEVDWKFSIENRDGKELAKLLQNDYFSDN